MYVRCTVFPCRSEPLEKHHNYSSLSNNQKKFEIIIDLFHNGSKVNQSSVVEVKQVSCYASSVLCIGFFHKRSKVNQSSVVEVKQVSCYATSMLCIGFFHKRSKGESLKHGGGKTSELLCNKHGMYRVLSQWVKGESIKHGGGKTFDLECKELWSMIKVNVYDSVAQDTHIAAAHAYALNGTKDLL